MKYRPNFRRDRQAKRLAEKKSLLTESRDFDDWKLESGRSKMQLKEFFSDSDGFNDPDVDPEDPHGIIYRQRGKRYPRGLPRHLQDEHSRQAGELAITNPFISRMSNLTADFIIGGGVDPVSPVQQLLDFVMAMWEDRINDFEERQHQYAKEYITLGELVWERVPKLTGLGRGMVRINARDQLEIVDVIGHKRFTNIPAGILFRHEDSHETFVAHIINTMPADMRPTVADNLPMVYFFRSMAVTGNLRGISAYFASLEWADLLDSSSFMLLERMVILLTYCWHLQMENYDADEAEVHEAKLQEAGPNTAMVTGPGTKLTAISPELRNADAKVGADYGREIVAMGAGFPVNWMGSPGQANIGEAASMDMPTLRTLTRQQRSFLNGPLKRTFDDAIDIAWEFGDFQGIQDQNGNAIETVTELKKHYKFQATPVSKKELGQVTNSLQTLTSALGLAQQENFIEKKEAALMWRSIANEIHVLERELPKQLEELIKQGVNGQVVNDFRKMARGMVPTGANGHPPVPEGPGSSVDAISDRSA